MSYATQQDLVDRFGEEELVQLTDRDNAPATTIDATVVGKALGDADALIDSYVGKQYALPLASAPPILTRYAADIARFYLFGERADKDHPVRGAFDLALTWLKDVARGLVKLDDGTGSEASAEGGGQVRFDVAERVNSRDSLKDF